MKKNKESNISDEDIDNYDNVKAVNDAKDKSSNQATYKQKDEVHHTNE